MFYESDETYTKRIERWVSAEKARIAELERRKNILKDQRYKQFLKLKGEFESEELV
jgi:hypothetical protein